jgi:hypothetical protein
MYFPAVLFGLSKAARIEDVGRVTTRIEQRESARPARGSSHRRDRCGSGTFGNDRRHAISGPLARVSADHRDPACGSLREVRARGRKGRDRGVRAGPCDSRRPARALAAGQRATSHLPSRLLAAHRRRRVHRQHRVQPRPPSSATGPADGTGRPLTIKIIRVTRLASRCNAPASPRSAPSWRE